MQERALIALLCINMHKNQINIKLYTKSVKQFMAYMEKSNYGLM
jgi:predicted transcriptional regulator YheO